MRTLAQDDVPKMLVRLFYAVLLRSVIGAIDAGKLTAMAAKFDSRAPLSREENIYLLQLAHWVRPGDASIAGSLKALMQLPPG